MNERKILISMLIGCTILMITGCASIVSKSSYPINISSQPEQADITIFDEKGRTVYTGKTPTTVTLEARAGYFQGKNYTIAFTKEGYAKYTAPIERSVDGWYIAGNCLFGGLIGWLFVDPATGAMWTLQKDINVTLSSQDSSGLNKSELRVVMLNDVPIPIRSKMVKVY